MKILTFANDDQRSFSMEQQLQSLFDVFIIGLHAWRSWTLEWPSGKQIDSSQGRQWAIFISGTSPYLMHHGLISTCWGTTQKWGEAGVICRLNRPSTLPHDVSYQLECLLHKAIYCISFNKCHTRNGCHIKKRLLIAGIVIKQPNKAGLIRNTRITRLTWFCHYLPILLCNQLEYPNTQLQGAQK